MSMHTLEKCYKIYDNETGESVQVCDDADCGDLTDVRYVDETGKIGARITLSDEQLVLLYQALAQRIRDKGLKTE